MSLPSTHVLSRHASAHLMEEIVHLWELTIMTPYLNKDTKLQMKVKFEFWNQQVVESGRKGDSSIHVYIFIVFLAEIGESLFKFFQLKLAIMLIE